MNRVKVNRLGQYGYDINQEVTSSGLYSIPIPDYDDITDEGVIYIDVDIRRVIMPPESRLHVIMGYDENNESQMWYYNGASRVFKRIWQDGVLGGYKTVEVVSRWLQSDANIKDDSVIHDIAEWFMSLE